MEKSSITTQLEKVQLKLNVKKTIKTKCEKYN